MSDAYTYCANCKDHFLPGHECPALSEHVKNKMQIERCTQLAQELGWEIEKLPGSPEQTEAIVRQGSVRTWLIDMLQKANEEK